MSQKQAWLQPRRLLLLLLPRHQLLLRPSAPLLTRLLLPCLTKPAVKRQHSAAHHRMTHVVGTSAGVKSQVHHLCASALVTARICNAPPYATGSVMATEKCRCIFNLLQDWQMVSCAINLSPKPTQVCHKRQWLPQLLLLLTASADDSADGAGGVPATLLSFFFSSSLNLANDSITSLSNCTQQGKPKREWG